MWGGRHGSASPVPTNGRAASITTAHNAGSISPTPMSRAEVCCATIRRQAEVVELRSAGAREIDAGFGGAVPAGLHVKILLRYTARRMTSSPPMTADELIALLDGEGLLGPAASRDALRQSVFGARREVAASDFATTSLTAAMSSRPWMPYSPKWSALMLVTTATCASCATMPRASVI